MHSFVYRIVVPAGVQRVRRAEAVPTGSPVHRVSRSSRSPAIGQISDGEGAPARAPGSGRHRFGPGCGTRPIRTRTRMQGATSSRMIVFPFP
ncbi:hypothetical protein BED46_021265 [Burkholderia contaminans]|uniref:Uncharacterized protein n=1 Tax=Burkholderia contaminans LMG 23361 TaxID=1334628 RepID=A0ABD4AYZ9_9BURK|nr:hypothetical protein WR31_12105 [Burkholderia contaminans LMG 23361]MBA9831322.1 hypothetical protein [Burkholderia contaminans]MBA9839574.1 hypothetical protein [Burkholderia contaminans]MBA9864549.1 hypothetical protein [Burkholderia contaminans]MBA9907015.1 hypothetical protein [Burkholderia contaminans]